jgi:diguanylate cyclase (GGDEF)-like protein
VLSLPAETREGVFYLYKYKPMHSSIEQERQHFDQQRRRTYQIAGLIGILMVTIDIFAIYFDPQDPPLLKFIYIANDLLLIAITVWVIWNITTRRMKLSLLERIVFFVFTAESLTFNGFLPPLLGQSLTQRWNETINDDIWFLLMICTLGFHLFSDRRALAIVGGLYGLSVAIVGGQTLLVLMGNGEIEAGLRSLQVYGMGAIFLCFIYIVSRYRAQAQRLQIEYRLIHEWAFIDLLTGLANRRRCEQVLQEAIERSQRYGEIFTICFWDLDHFKKINDLFGHEMGDQVLRQVSQLAQLLVRSTDIIGRWGGEEFFLLMPRTRKNEAAALAERLRQHITLYNGLNQWVVSASFGLAEYQPTDTQATLLSRADRALYMSKRNGRNRVCMASNENEKTAFYFFSQ